MKAVGTGVFAGRAAGAAARGLVGRGVSAEIMTDEPPEATSEGWAETQHEGCGYVGLCWTGGGGRGAGACWPGSICWSILPIPGNAFTYHGWFACCAAL